MKPSSDIRAPAAAPAMRRRSSISSSRPSRATRLTTLVASERLYTMLGLTGNIRSVATHVPSNRDVRGHMKKLTEQFAQPLTGSAFWTLEKIQTSRLPAASLLSMCR
jgi:hypothetical protein